MIRRSRTSMTILQLKRSVDGRLRRLGRSMDARFERLERSIQSEIAQSAEETRRHFDVVSESMRDETRLIGPRPKP
jgi:hypothetical protein